MRRTLAASAASVVVALLAAAPRHLAKHSRASLQLAGISSELATVLRVTGLSEQFGAGDSSA